MLPELLEKVSLFRILHQIDSDLSKQHQQTPCSHCGGPLHQSNYERKPRGGPKKIPGEYLIRHSLCCGREDCRHRSLPPSCRFMGQRVYWSCVILVVMTLRQNRPESASARKLQELFGINRNTVKRWAEYFRDEFPASVQWRRIRGRVTPWVTDELLPGVLVSYFFDNFPTHEQALIGCLKFLASGLASIRGA